MPNLGILREWNLVSVLVRILASVLTGGLVGMERGKHGRAAGLRTHILVSLGACLTAVCGLYLTEEAHVSADVARLAAQVVSGIGFLGVGTIVIKGRFQVSGLTTAAGLWATAAIGICTGYGFFEATVIGTACAVLTITLLSRLEAVLNRRSRRIGMYLELDSVEAVEKTAEYLKQELHADDIQVTAPRSAAVGHTGIEATVLLRTAGATSEEILSRVRALDHTVFVLESI